MAVSGRRLRFGLPSLTKAAQEEIVVVDLEPTHVVHVVSPIEV